MRIECLLLTAKIKFDLKLGNLFLQTKVTFLVVKTVKRKRGIKQIQIMLLLYVFYL